MTNYTEEALSKVFKDNGVIFAFSQKQFDEQKVAGVKYVEMGSGDLCPKENVKKYLHEAGLAIDSGIKKDVEDNGAEAIIKREYFNYETQLSGDLDDMINALSSHVEQFPELFTNEVIKKVSAECFQDAVNNDWF